MSHRSCGTNNDDDNDHHDHHVHRRDSNSCNSLPSSFVLSFSSDCSTKNKTHESKSEDFLVQTKKKNAKRMTNKTKSRTNHDNDDNGDAILSMDQCITSSTTVSQQPPLSSSSSSSLPVLKLPSRPLSAYNLFFRMERQYIIEQQSESSENLPTKVYTTEEVTNFAYEQRQHNYIEKPEVKPRRKHCKTHGKISFANLARHVATRWRTMPNEQRGIFQQCYQREMDYYRTIIVKWVHTSNHEQNQQHQQQHDETESSSAVFMDDELVYQNDPDEIRSPIIPQRVASNKPPPQSAEALIPLATQFDRRSWTNSNSIRCSPPRFSYLSDSVVDGNMDNRSRMIEMEENDGGWNEISPSPMVQKLSSIPQQYLHGRSSLGSATSIVRSAIPPLPFVDPISNNFDMDNDRKISDEVVESNNFDMDISTRVTAQSSFLRNNEMMHNTGFRPQNQQLFQRQSQNQFRQKQRLQYELQQRQLQLQREQLRQLEARTESLFRMHGDDCACYDCCAMEQHHQQQRQQQQPQQRQLQQQPPDIVVPLPPPLKRLRQPLPSLPPQVQIQQQHFVPAEDRGMCAGTATSSIRTTNVQHRLNTNPNDRRDSQQWKARIQQLQQKVLLQQYQIQQQYQKYEQQRQQQEQFLHQLQEQDHYYDNVQSEHSSALQDEEDYNLRMMTVMMSRGQEEDDSSDNINNEDFTTPF